MAVPALDQHKWYKGPPLTGTIRLFWISWQIRWFIVIITTFHTFPYILTQTNNKQTTTTTTTNKQPRKQSYSFTFCVAKRKIHVFAWYQDVNLHPWFISAVNSVFLVYQENTYLPLRLPYYYYIYFYLTATLRLQSDETQICDIICVMVPFVLLLKRFHIHVNET